MDQMQHCIDQGERASVLDRLHHSELCTLGQSLYLGQRTLWSFHCRCQRCVGSLASLLPPTKEGGWLQIDSRHHFRNLPWGHHRSIRHRSLEQPLVKEMLVWHRDHDCHHLLFPWTLRWSLPLESSEKASLKRVAELHGQGSGGRRKGQSSSADLWWVPHAWQACCRLPHLGFSFPLT